MSLDPVTILAVGLLVVGVVGSVVPLLPGPLLSLAGVYLYWWHTGYAEPDLFALVGFTLVGVVAVAVDHLGGAVAARAGGASLLTTAAAVVVGVVLGLLAGPVGFLLGVAGTVFVVEYAQHGAVRRGIRTALFATVGVLASGVVQVLLTGSMLVAFLLLLA